MLAYLDTSGFIKLVRSEAESHALREELRRTTPELISSILLSVEARRADRRYGRLAFGRANAALATITLVAIDQPIIEIAADLQPAELRSLDALHLATILSLGEDVERVYCYDARLTSAARSLGLDAVEPA